MGNDTIGGSDWLPKLACELERHRLAELVDAIDREVRHRLASYAELPKAAGFREGLERTAVTYCRTLAERRGLTDNERLRLHVTGSQRARHGLAPEDMVAAVDIAVAVGWRLTIGLLGTLGAEVRTVEAVSVEAFPLALAFADEVREALLFGFRSDGEEPVPAQVRAQASVIDRLLAGGADDEELFEAARTQSLDVRLPCGLLLVTAASPSTAAPLRPAATAIARIPRLIEGPGRHSATPPHVILLASAVDDWLPLLSAVGDVARARGVVAVGLDGPVPRLVDLADAYHGLAADLHLARRARRGGGLVPARTLALYRALAHIPPQERAELVTQTLGGVLAKREKGETYLQAYEAWLEAECDFRAAGERLGDAEHTVRYRIGMVEKLSGIPAKSSEGRIRLDLAVRLWRAWVRDVLAD